MSIELDVRSMQDAATEATLHLMPCEIEYTGPANVESYFTTGIQKTDKGSGMTGSFRGRPLNGKKMSVPTGYTGLVLTEPRQRFSEDETRKFTVSHQFSEFTFWNLDAEPSENDKFMKAMHWFDLAKVIHGPVGEESDSQKSIVGK